MVATALADAGFLVALLDRRDRYHDWAITAAARYSGPWQTCEAVISEAFFLLGREGGSALGALLERGRISAPFHLDSELESVLRLMGKYSDVPIGLADACLLRMSELLDEVMVLTVDHDFLVYRRNGHQIVPCLLPS